MTRLTLSIGQAARACGLNAKTIRYYEQIGLVPAALRTNLAARTVDAHVQTADAKAAR